jgi:hypothetical protein
MPCILEEMVQIYILYIQNYFFKYFWKNVSNAICACIQISRGATVLIQSQKHLAYSIVMSVCLFYEYWITMLIFIKYGVNAMALEAVPLS